MNNYISNACSTYVVLGCWALEKCHCTSLHESYEVGTDRVTILQVRN